MSNKSKIKGSHQEVQQAQTQAQLVAHRHEEMTIHSGPIPAPEVIEGYEKILPGAADRIIKMAEVEQQHQHSYADKGQSHAFIATIVGQIFGFLICSSGIIGGAVLVYHDKPLSGFGMFVTSLGSLVGIFIFQKRRKKSDQPK